MRILQQRINFQLSGLQVKRDRIKVQKPQNDSVLLYLKTNWHNLCMLGDAYRGGAIIKGSISQTLGFKPVKILTYVVTDWHRNVLKYIIILNAK